MTTLRCISADSHVVEPPNLWLDHIAPEFRERAPHVVNEDGVDVFKVEGVDLIPIAGGSAAGRTSQQMAKGTYEEVTFKGAYDPTERLKDMDADGIDGDVVYPTMALRMFSIDDPRLLSACFAAYNDWIAQFCGTHPDRLRGLALIPLHDIDGAVLEIERAKQLGLSAIIVGIQPEDDDLQYDSPVFDPIWSTAQSTGMPVSMHVLTNKAKIASRNAITKSTDSVYIQRTLAALIFGGVFERFPKLKVISAENDAGWAPYFMGRMDYVFGKGMASAYPIAKGTAKPSEYFKQNVYCTFMRDRSGVLVREHIGLKNLLWSTDYPHFDSTFPHSQKVIDEIFEGVPDNEKQQIIAGNAIEMYGF